MQQLKENGIIRHNIVSFFTTMYGKNQSSIKFGGWDQEAIMAGHSLQMIKTVALDTWKVRLYQFEINDLIQKLKEGIIRNVLFEP